MASFWCCLKCMARNELDPSELTSSEVSLQNFLTIALVEGGIDHCNQLIDGHAKSKKSLLVHNLYQQTRSLISHFLQWHDSPAEFPQREWQSSVMSHFYRDDHLRLSDDAMVPLMQSLLTPDLSDFDQNPVSEIISLVLPLRQKRGHRRAAESFLATFDYARRCVSSYDDAPIQFLTKSASKCLLQWPYSALLVHEFSDLLKDSAASSCEMLSYTSRRFKVYFVEQCLPLFIAILTCKRPSTMRLLKSSFSSSGLFGSSVPLY